MTYDELIDTLDEFQEGERKFCAPMSNNRRFLVIQKVEYEIEATYETITIITETLKPDGTVSYAFGSAGYTPQELIDEIEKRGLDKVQWEELA